MISWLVRVGGGVLTVVVAALVLQVVSLRTGWKPGVRAIRRLTRVMNRSQMKTAGRPGAYAALICHPGRRTGTRYETPVGVVGTEAGLVIALPYGTSTDWLKNVMTAGSAELVYEGETFPVDRPEVVSSREVDSHAGRMDRFLQSLYGVDQALLVRRAESSLG